MRTLHTSTWLYLSDCLQILHLPYSGRYSSSILIHPSYWKFAGLSRNSPVYKGLRRRLLQEDKTTETVITINITEVAESCSLLNSLIQEMLRLQSANPSARVVTHDTILDGDSLKKGTFIMLPSAVVHRNKSTWVVTAREFDAFRFMPHDSSGTNEE